MKWHFASWLTSLALCSTHSFSIAQSPAMVWSKTPNYETRVSGSTMPLVVRDMAGLDRRLYDDSFAVFFIERNYGNGWTSPRAEADRSSRLLQKALESRGYHVLIWNDLSASAMRATLADVVANIGHINDARLFFYYFGHGTQLGTGDDADPPRSYLVPSDAADPEKDLPAFYRSSLPISMLVDAAKSMTLKHAFFALEACRAGGILASLSAPPAPNPQGYLFGTSAKRQVRQFLTAGDATQDVPPGAFTALLVGAMEEVTSNGDGYVTGTDVMSYVAHQAPRYSTEFPLSPEYGSIPHSGGGDMIIGPLTNQTSSASKTKITPQTIVTAGKSSAIKPDLGIPSLNGKINIETFTVLQGDGNVFEHNESSYWTDRPVDGKCCTYKFTEVSRTIDSISLYDPTRDLTMRLPIPQGQGTWRQGSAGPWQPWYEVAYRGKR